MSGVFDINEIKTRFPPAADTMLVDTRLTDEQEASCRVFRIYVDVPEAEEFGAIDFEFRDAGQKLANDVRQASVASRKKRGM